MHQTPRHEHASKYARSSIFSGLASFNELERRIELLPTEMDRGAAFEVFVEAYLNVSEMAQTEEVWVCGTVPAEIRGRLNLPSRDYGYDGVFRTKVGELVAYQAKFRSKRAALSYTELATFCGISERADSRIVLTNSIAIAAVAESRTAFQSTRGGDFDRLDASQLETISEWIAGVPSAPQQREPRQHQAAALADIKRELVNQDRATIVMACGTGKTLVGLWAAEDVGPQRVLVLLPSLNLLRQTLHEWARWTSWGDRFRYLCVCSDPKVGTGMDQIDIHPEDADFPVRTDPSVVRKFLASGGDGSVSVVFSTYQSAHVVGNAVGEFAPFDVGIFDEAHKTTGREGARFSFALNDANLPIRKRIFFTATPRRFNIRKRDQDGEFSVVSMDDLALYGRVAHRLTFSQAVHQKLIVPYKIIISIVDSQTIDNETIEQSEVAIEGDQIRAKWVANQLAIQRAVDQYDLKRIITFHSRVSAAAAFTSDSSEGIRGLLPNFHCFHVSGAQPTAERDENMREFARVPRGIVSNARCLTEGVDIPSVDMVAFMNAKRSRVDIVQAVGRAMRTSGDGKTCGYVLVPLFLDSGQGESIAQAIQRSGYSEIADVLNAMRENDEKLGDLIEELSIEKGRTGGFDESRLRNLVEVLGPQIQLEALSKAIRTTLVDELGSSWHEKYGQLMAYKEAYGTCDIPVRWPEWQVLSNWCSSQKIAYRAKTLTQERLNKLEAIGFSWGVQRKTWDEMYAALNDYKTFHGDCDVQLEWQADSELFDWCSFQKNSFQNKTISQEREKKLFDIGLLAFSNPLVKPVANLVKTRQGVFARGVIGSPFKSIFGPVAEALVAVLPLGARIPENSLQQALIEALNLAAWVDCGRIASADYQTKKHIFCAPELVHLSKSELRREVEADLPAPKLSNSALVDENSQSLLKHTQESFHLENEIQERKGVFAIGIVGSPFHQLCDRISSSRGRIHIAQLLQALKNAGWVDCGRIASAEYQTKKHIFCAPELVHLSKSELRRTVENDVPISTHPTPALIDKSPKTQSDSPSSLSSLASEIQQRKGVFAIGIVGSPFHQLCNSISSSSGRVHKAQLLQALKNAGWVDCGRLASAEYQTKKHIFCAPELVHLSKSELRRAVGNDAPISTHPTPALIDKSPKTQSDSPSSLSSLASEIQQRKGVFASGIVGSPFQQLCDNISSSSGRVHKAQLLQALKDAGWVDCGRLGSADFQTKKHIFCASELTQMSMSELRRAVEEFH